MQIFKLSVTNIRTAVKECELKLYYNLTEPKPPKNVYLFMGIVFHSVIAEDLKFKAKNGNDMELGMINGIFRDTFEKEKVGIDFAKMPEFEAKARCQNYIKAYWEKRLQHLYPYLLNGQKPLIEHFLRFTAKFEEQQISITGKIDMLDRTGWVVDHKTSNRPENWEEEPQAYLYPLGLKNQGFKVEGFIFSTVDSQGNVDSHEIEFKQEKADALLQKAFEIQRAFSEDNILPTSNQRVCTYCQHKGICREWNSI